MLGNALSGLQASQYALNVVSQNVANVNTPGYSRQEAIFAARTSLGFGDLAVGSGVEINALRRISDGYINASLWRANTQSGYDDQYETLVKQTEAIIGSDDLNISDALDSFYEALNAASASPEDIAARQEVIASARSMSYKFTQISSELDEQERQIGDGAKAIVTGVNSQTQIIADLNDRIIEVSAKGGNTATLEDQRDSALLALSEYVDVKTSTQANGSVTVSLSAGQPLVIDGQASTMTLTGEDLAINFANESFPVAAHQVGGSLGANREYIQDELAGYRTQLNDLAQSIADKVNTQLQAGYDLNSDPGVALFSYDPLNPAGSLAINAAMTPEKLAFIGDDGGGNPIGGIGDNTNIQAILGQADGFYNDYSELISGLAVSSARVQSLAASSRSLLDDATNKRDGMSGVNRDEEATNLLNYSQSYQANAKVISTAGELFDTLMRMF